MAFVVVYDACVLYPAAVRDLLIRLAASGLFQARWTDRILDECFRSIVRARPELAGRLDRTRALMEAAVPAAKVTGYEPLVATLTLPDEDDRHVLAAAIKCSAQAIVTTNLRDFPVEALAPWEMEAQHPDTFVLHLLSLDPGAVVRAVVVQAAGLKAPPVTVPELLSILEARGLVQTAGELPRLM